MCNASLHYCQGKRYNYLKWYETHANINVNNSVNYVIMKYFIQFKILQYLAIKISFYFVLKLTVKIAKGPAGFKLATYSYVMNTLTHCATLLSNIILRDFFLF